MRYLTVFMALAVLAVTVTLLPLGGQGMLIADHSVTFVGETIPASATVLTQP